MIPNIHLPDYNYTLPDGKIPNFPTIERDKSKLLYYKKGVISSHIFNEISDLLPPESLLVFNDTRVFPARLIFKKATGSEIEIFCLQPVSLQKLTDGVSEIQWLCMVGNQKRWKGDTLENEFLSATFVEKRNAESVIKFTWKGDIDVYSVFEQLAELPLPPYMNRKATKEDQNRYQTVYAKEKGSVAAPTAGLHFTEKVLKSIADKGIKSQKLTLHVGAGTFKPIKTEKINEHDMHAERFTISSALIKSLLENNFVVAVGTTSMRVLESLYWLGMQLETTQTVPDVFINQWEPYQNMQNISTKKALQNIYNYMVVNKLDSLNGQTRIIIIPGYAFKVCKGIITNFHQPESTLILLIAAFLGADWKSVYEFALQNDFRFLSYGDSSLLIP